MDRELIRELDMNYKKKELNRENVNKYKAKYIYTDLERYEELYHLTEKKIEEFISINKFKDNIKIEGVSLDGISNKNKNILAVKFNLLENKFFCLIPLDNEFREIIYFDNSNLKIFDEIEKYSLSEAMRKVEKYIKAIECLGYFDDYNDNEKYYLEALKTYDFQVKIYYLKVKEIVKKLIEADLILEKIDIKSIDNKKLLSNIYYIKSCICETKVGLLGINCLNEADEYWKKSIEYNNKNINLLIREFEKPIEEIVANVEKKTADKSSRDIEKIGIAIKNLDFEYIEDFIEKLAEESILEEIKNISKKDGILIFKLKLITLYQNLLEKLKVNNHHIGNEGLKIINNIIDILKENTKEANDNEEKEDVINIKNIDKYKILADALYFNGKYENAIEYYKKILEIYVKECDSLTLSNKIFNKNMKKEIYMKIIQSYIELNDYKNAREEYEKIIKECKDSNILKKLDNMLSK